MGLYIGFKLFNKDETIPLLSEDGKTILCEDDDFEDEISMEVMHSHKNTVVRDLLKEVVSNDEESTVILTQEHLAKLLEIVKTRNWLFYQLDLVEQAKHLFTDLPKVVDWDAEYLAYYIN